MRAAQQARRQPLAAEPEQQARCQCDGRLSGPEESPKLSPPRDSFGYSGCAHRRPPTRLSTELRLSGGILQSAECPSCCDPLFGRRREADHGAVLLHPSRELGELVPREGTLPHPNPIKPPRARPVDDRCFVRLEKF